jgi:hypothetical protein
MGNLGYIVNAITIVFYVIPIANGAVAVQDKTKIYKASWFGFFDTFVPL